MLLVHRPISMTSFNSHATLLNKEVFSLIASPNE